MSAGTARPAAGLKPIYLLAALVAAFVLVDARWIWLYRRAQPLDIDEAGYLSIALFDWGRLRDGGLLGWIGAVEWPSIQAPITTALASLVFALTGPHVVGGFAIPILAASVTVAATYALARTLLPPGHALAAAALVATCPVVVLFSRSFHFSMVATAVLLVALVCLLRSARLSRAGWASGFGVCLGALPLARTMTIAFLPGLVLAALVLALGGTGRRMRRAGLFCWAMLLAGATAATWLAPNGAAVFGYLFSFGYGARAAEYGAKPPNLTDPATWMDFAYYVLANLYLPHFLLLLAAVLGLPLLLLSVVIRRGVRGLVASFFSSPALPLALTAAEGLAALASSQNKGSAFVAPLVPVMLILAVWVLTGISRARLYQGLIGGCCAVVCAVAAVPQLDLAFRAATPWVVTLPPFGTLTTTDGRGTNQLYEAINGFTGGRPTQPVPPAAGAAWIELSRLTAAILHDAAGERAPVAFAFRPVLFNINTVMLLDRLGGTAAPGHFLQIEPAVTGDTEAGDQSWLVTGDARAACWLLTLEGQGEEFSPQVDKAAMLAAAGRSGFERQRGWLTPDGRTVALWHRQPAEWRCEPG